MQGHKTPPPYLTSPMAVLVPLPRLIAAADESVEAAARSSGLTPLYSTPARTPTKGRITRPAPLSFWIPPICVGSVPLRHRIEGIFFVGSLPQTLMKSFRIQRSC